jgi:hypothetical protein
MINTSTKKELYREPVTDNQRNLGDRNKSEVTSGINSSNTIGSSSPNNSTQIVVLHEEGRAHSTMAVVDPTIILPEFHGDGTKKPKKHLFMCE